MKIQALAVLGDLSHNSGPEFNRRFLAQTLTIYKMASQAAVEQEVTSEDIENFEYILALRQELVEQYSLILVSVTENEDDEMNQVFYSHLDHVLFFIEQLTRKRETASSLSLIREMCNLLLDIIQNFKSHPEAIARLKQPWVGMFINFARTTQDKDIFETTNYIVEMLQAS